MKFEARVLFGIPRYLRDSYSSFGLSILSEILNNTYYPPLAPASIYIKKTSDQSNIILLSEDSFVSMLDTQWATNKIELQYSELLMTVEFSVLKGG